MKFEALLRAHGFMKTERPPEIWEAETEDVGFFPLLGEMIAAGLCGGAALEELTLSVCNIVVPADEDPRRAVLHVGDGDPRGAVLHAEEGDRVLAPGEFVGVTVRGRTDLGPDHTWNPGRPPAAHLLLARLDGRLMDAGVRFAYVRRMPPEGSVTVFLWRVRP